ncbi:hypothetical protein SAMN05446927_4594 [Caballeronia arationis]|uniref:Uncharacterized protein n=1 Tax=Caballeronia arationis TaxID=1777142 RepID=A0A7Z7IB25_9BURK|nr:hypothetical protein SAMN05446927_4594 [Caballeronia arationis]
MLRPSAPVRFGRPVDAVEEIHEAIRAETRALSAT